MFNITDISENLPISLQEGFSNSMREDFDYILRSTRMGISHKAAKLVGTVLSDLFKPNSDGTFPKPPKDFGDDYCGSGSISVMSSTGRTSPTNNDTLVAYCVDGDNLNSKLTKMLDAVRMNRFKNVFFLTSKWDVSAVTGNNIQRLQDLYELRQNGVDFCFVLVSISGASRIPVILP